MVVPVVSVRLDGTDESTSAQSRQELEWWLGSSVFAHNKRARLRGVQQMTYSTPLPPGPLPSL